jgi:RNA polymerase sigma-70 factor (ECF subfamily)
MLSQTVSRELLGEGLLCSVAEAGHQWVLAAMQSHGQALLTMLWRMLGNDQDVCDVYQNTFLHLAHGQEGKEPRNVRAYVFRTAANIAISLMRSRAAERRTLAATASPHQAIRCPDQELDQEYLMQSLRYHMTQLPDHLRQVVILRDLGDLPYGQISRIMGISGASARVYRCKAIQLLAVWMGQDGIGGRP